MSRAPSQPFKSAARRRPAHRVVRPVFAGLAVLLVGLAFEPSAAPAAPAAVRKSATKAKKPTAKPTTTVKRPATTTASKAVTTKPAGPSGRLDANTATVDELTAAFTKAGIPNADKWAAEVEEYRPYSADPAWGKLRHELGKYNIDPALLEKIISLLEV